MHIWGLVGDQIHVQVDQPDTVVLSLFGLHYVSLRGLTSCLRGCRLERCGSFKSLVAVHELCRHTARKGVTEQAAILRNEQMVRQKFARRHRMQSVKYPDLAMCVACY